MKYETFIKEVKRVVNATTKCVFDDNGVLTHISRPTRIDIRCRGTNVALTDQDDATIGVCKDDNLVRIYSTGKEKAIFVSMDLDDVVVVAVTMLKENVPDGLSDEIKITEYTGKCPFKVRLVESDDSSGCAP